MLALKLGLTPLLILAASLAGRRWGVAIGGWLVGLPLTSGPVSVFLTVDQGAEFARQAAAGTLAGTAAQAAFAVAYVHAARTGWPAALTAGSAGYVLCAGLLQQLGLSHLALFAIALLALAAGLAATPRGEAVAPAVISAAWDIPARMAVATGMVLAVTTAAAALGPRLSGIAASFPVFATVLAVFAHRGQGVASARLVMRGLLVGLYGFACFFATLGLLLTRVPSGAAFAGACLVAVLVQGGSFALMRRRIRASTSRHRRRCSGR